MAYYYTEFQSKLEMANSLSNMQGTPEKPYEYKYKARDIYNELLATCSKSTDRNALSATALLHFLLGENYSTTEESSPAEKESLIFLELVNKMDSAVITKYACYIQKAYNTIGVIKGNFNHLIEAIAHLNKAISIYKAFKSIAKRIHNNFSVYIRNSEGSRFQFYIEGGIDSATLESNYTHSLFYIAQAFTKIEDFRKGFEYCGLTMQRQVETNTYQVNDFVINSLDMTTFCTSNNYYAQAEYLLFAAEAILNRENPIDAQLLAKLQIAFGEYYSKLLEYSIEAYVKNSGVTRLQSINDVINKCFITYPSLNMNWPKITDISNIEDAKSLFRLANTQYKKALNYFVLDGYVTTHLQILKAISRLYKSLGAMEDSRARRFAMWERRLELLEATTGELNITHYFTPIMELANELTYIYSEMHEMKLEEGKEGKKFNKASFAKVLNELAFKSIGYSDKVISMIEKMQEKEQNTQKVLRDHFFSKAKLYSKLVSKERMQQVKYLEESLNSYKKIKESIDLTPNPDATSLEMKKMCIEMCELIPMQMAQCK